MSRLRLLQAMGMVSFEPSNSHEVLPELAKLRRGAKDSLNSRGFE